MPGAVRSASLACIGVLAGGAMASAQPAARTNLGPGLAAPAVTSRPVFLVEPVAHKVVDTLPPGPLHWRVESFPTLEAAKAAEAGWSLAAEAWGRAWLFTLGAAGETTRGGRKLAEVGPVPTPHARRFLMRVNRAGGPPGARTPVHTHPGSEAFFVLKGQLTQRTPHGLSRLGAGKVMNGHEPGMVMQLESTGSEPLEQLVLFVVDADKAFSTPASFEP